MQSIKNELQTGIIKTCMKINSKYFTSKFIVHRENFWEKFSIIV